MIANMRRKGNDLVSSKEKTNYAAPEVYEMPIVEPALDEEYAEVTAIEEEEEPVVENKFGDYGIPENIERILSSAVDFDTTVVAINQTRERVMNVSEQADLATQAANASDKELEEVSSKYSKAEKELQEKEMRSKEMEQRIMTLLHDERTRLSKALQEKEEE